MKLRKTTMNIQKLQSPNWSSGFQSCFFHNSAVDKVLVAHNHYHFPCYQVCVVITHNDVSYGFINSWLLQSTCDKSAPWYMPLSC
jgi:hypothetical protein